jgi:Mrp family chromosome partitioning ATPase
MSHLVKDIRDRYTSRIIIFDLPPLLHIDDALTFLPQVQSSLLVVEDGVNTPGEIKQCLHLLENSNLLGTVYNKAHRVSQSPY